MPVHPAVRTVGIEQEFFVGSHTPGKAFVPLGSMEEQFQLVSPMLLPETVPCMLEIRSGRPQLSMAAAREELIALRRSALEVVTNGGYVLIAASVLTSARDVPYALDTYVQFCGVHIHLNKNSPRYRGWTASSADELCIELNKRLAPVAAIAQSFPSRIDLSCARNSTGKPERLLRAARWNRGASDHYLTAPGRNKPTMEVRVADSIVSIDDIMASAALARAILDRLQDIGPLRCEPFGDFSMFTQVGSTKSQRVSAVNDCICAHERYLRHNGDFHFLQQWVREFSVRDNEAARIRVLLDKWTGEGRMPEEIDMLATDHLIATTAASLTSTTCLRDPAISPQTVGLVDGG